MQKAPVTGHQGSPSGRTETWTRCEMHVPRSSLAESTRNLMVQSRALKQSLEKLERHVDIQKHCVVVVRVADAAVVRWTVRHGFPGAAWDYFVGCLVTDSRQVQPMFGQQVF